MMHLTASKQLHRFGLILLSMLMAWSVILSGASLARAEADEDDGPTTGAVYTLTNAPSPVGNAVAVFQRDQNGKLTLSGTVATGGNGTGAGLGSQSPITLSQNGRWLFAVNAASDSVSVFKVKYDGNLILTATVPSGGTRPTSLTSYKDLLYVLNAGGTGNITGFTLTEAGGLIPLANSTRPLSGSNVAPAQVAFSPKGNLLVVTERATSLIDTYTVDKNGLASGPTSFASAGTTPFGFAFDRDRLIVSEAAASTASSYQVSKDGKLAVITASAPTHQIAACWVVVTPNGKFAYTANAGSSTLTGYRVSPEGELIPVSADGRTGVMPAGTGPQDMAISQNGRFLYVSDVRAGKIASFKVQPDGQLLALEDVGGLPLGSVGVAAR